MHHVVGGKHYKGYDNSQIKVTLTEVEGDSGRRALAAPAQHGLCG